MSIYLLLGLHLKFLRLKSPEKETYESIELAYASVLFIYLTVHVPRDLFC